MTESDADPRPERTASDGTSAPGDSNDDSDADVTRSSDPTAPSRDPAPASGGSSTWQGPPGGLPPAGQYPPGPYPPGSYPQGPPPGPPPGQYPPGSYPPGQFQADPYPAYPAGQYPPAQPGDVDPSAQTHQLPGPYPGYPPTGALPPGYSGQHPAPGRPNNGMAVASLVLGIVGLVVCWGVASIPAVITGHIARKQIRERNEDGAGLALAGIIMGWFGIALVGIFLAVFVGVLFWPSIGNF